MAKLKDKVAIITGGSGGLGEAAAELFVAEGARVVIADLDQARGDALAARLGEAAIFRRADVSREEEVQQLIEAAVSHFGGLHVMFNNAAISSAFHLQLQDDDFADFQRVMNVNLLGVIWGTQLAARHMMAHGGGSIINTSATSGIEAGYGVATYRITKAGVNHFSKSAAIDYGAHNIRVNCIAPGNISTEMNAFNSGDADTEQARQWAQTLEQIRMAPQPLKRHGTPRDVAEAALFLASDDSAFVTGTVLPVDGGITCGASVS